MTARTITDTIAWTGPRGLASEAAPNVAERLLDEVEAGRADRQRAQDLAILQAQCAERHMNWAVNPEVRRWYACQRDLWAGAAAVL